ncbi:DNA-directed RNA polymerase I complex subunit Rpa43 [Planoprotostelium fungivorum]|uniref:DNA-directed RNA polymerase I complex subunit Rpa43 n=1 Tax=Planoprotostelium fungivorum TaxID=1890364 RepID=A0A2P6NBQ6_9EUKA|nr:DNA-directed RNA polymerase I complex subunit Rpa43 [Planoprotostelium fungivorum]
MTKGSTEFVQVQVEQTVQLSPYYTGREMLGVTNHLNTLLLRYIPTVDSVLLSYKDVKIRVEKGRIRNESPIIYLPITYTALLFKPVIGQPLEGKVIQIGYDHIGMLVDGLFNASIFSDQLSPAFEPSQFEDKWESKTDSSVSISVGSTVRFIVDGQGAVRNKQKDNTEVYEVV